MTSISIDLTVRAARFATTAGALWAMLWAAPITARAGNIFEDDPTVQKVAPPPPLVEPTTAPADPGTPTAPATPTAPIAPNAPGVPDAPNAPGAPGDPLPTTRSARREYLPQHLPPPVPAFIPLAAEQKGTPVTIHQNNVLPRLAFEALGKPLAWSFEPVFKQNLWERLESTRVTVHGVGRPFWDVVRELSEKSGVDVVALNGTTLFLRQRQAGANASDLAYCASGRMLFTALKSFADSEGNHQLHMQAFFEPGIRGISWESLRIDSITENTGKPATILNAFFTNLGAQGGWAVNTPHVKTSPAATSLASVKGTATFLALTKTQTIQLKHLKDLHDTQIICGDLALNITYLPWESGFAIQAETSCPPGGDAERARVFGTLAHHMGPAVTDSQGVKFVNRIGSASSPREGVHRTTAYYHSGGTNPVASDGDVLTWEVPLAVERYEAPFELKNIALGARITPLPPPVDLLAAQLTVRGAKPPGTVMASPQPAAFSPPKLISLNLKAEAARAAFQQLAAKTGLQFDGLEPEFWNRVGTRPVTINAQEWSFWDVARPLFLQARCMPLMTVGNQVKMNVLTPDKTWDRAPFTICGPLLITAPAPYVVPIGTRAANLRLSAMVEPTRSGSSWELMQVDSVTDDTGAAVPMPEVAVRKLHGTFSSGIASRAIMLQPGPRATRLQSIKGRASFLMREETETLQIDNVARARNLRGTAGGMRFEFTCQPTLEGCSLDVIVRPGARTFEDFKVLVEEMIFAIPAVSDAAGHRLYYGGRAMSYVTEAGIHLVITYKRSLFPPNQQPRPRTTDANAVGPATTLTWDVATSLSRYESPFEIKDVMIQAKN